MFFVRSAGPEDLDKVSALMRRSWHATYDRLYGEDKVAELTAKWHSVEALKKQLDSPHSEFLVADDGRKIGGMAFALMAGDEKDVALVRQIYVDPDLTGQGIGRDLFAEIETCFPEARRLRLEVEPENERAIRFYKGLGFAEIGWTKNCGSADSGIPALIFEKELDF